MASIPGARASTKPGAARRRDSVATRQRILEAARSAFALEGYAGARIEHIARASESNVQMIYRYFDDKEGLYLAALEDTYVRIRSMEAKLELGAMPPLDGMKRLIAFTFDYLRDNPEFVAIVRNENLMEGRFVQKLQTVSDTANPLVESIGDLLARGTSSGVFRAAITAMDLYVTILALCITHIAQRHTLSAMFRFDFGDPAWLAQRREHVEQLVLGYLTSPVGATD